MYAAKPLLCITILAVSTQVIADTDYSPYVENVPRRVFWGDTHLHTSNSVDAIFFGATLSVADAIFFGATLSVADAYRFAMGEVVTSSTLPFQPIPPPICAALKIDVQAIQT